DPTYAGLIGRDQAIATQTIRGGSLIGVYPLDRYRRLQMSAGLQQLSEEFSDPTVAALSQQYASQSSVPVFRNGTVLPLNLTFISETTVFPEFGPLAGSTMKFGYPAAPKLGSFLSQQTFDADARYYQRIAGTGVLALRLRGYKSMGDYPSYTFFGGNSE